MITVSVYVDYEILAEADLLVISYNVESNLSRSHTPRIQNGSPIFCVFFFLKKLLIELKPEILFFFIEGM